MFSGQLESNKKGEPKLFSWAKFPDGDLLKYFEWQENGYWFWGDKIKDIPKISSTAWLTSSHIIKNESTVNLSVSFLISAESHENDEFSLQKSIFEALESQGPSRNPTYSRKHSILINSIVAKRVSKMPKTNEKWLTKNMHTFRIPVISFEYEIGEKTEFELLHDEITNYFNGLKMRTNNQSRKALFKMYSMEWMNWILRVTAINALFEQTYYNKLYKELKTMPQEMANKFRNESPGCLQMLMNMWKKFWFKELHFETILRDLIEDSCEIVDFNEYPEIIRSYDMLGYSRLKIQYESKFCAEQPKIYEINNFINHLLQKKPKIRRNYTLEQFISRVCAQTFSGEDETIRMLEENYGTDKCKECEKNIKKLNRKQQQKIADQKRRQKNDDKKSELSIVMKRNENLKSEVRSLNISINKLKTEIQNIDSAVKCFISLNE